MTAERCGHGADFTPLVRRDPAWLSQRHGPRLESHSRSGDPAPEAENAAQRVDRIRPVEGRQAEESSYGAYPVLTLSRAAGGDGRRRSRAELAAEAQRMRAAGLTCRAIGKALGVSRSYAGELAGGDPLGARAKQRKQRYASVCVDCGSPTSGGEGRKAEPRCVKCAARPAALKRTVWTRERIIEALQDAARVLGRDPAVVDFNPYFARRIRQDEARARLSETMINAGRWPWSTTIYSRFGSFNAAKEAAGMTALPPYGTAESRKRARRA